jgi:hypothetical protein
MVLFVIDADAAAGAGAGGARPHHHQKPFVHTENTNTEDIKPNQALHTAPPMHLYTPNHRHNEDERQKQPYAYYLQLHKHNHFLNISTPLVSSTSSATQKLHGSLHQTPASNKFNLYTSN